VLGPCTAPIGRIKGVYRFHLILKASSRKALNAALRGRWRMRRRLECRGKSGGGCGCATINVVLWQGQDCHREKRYAHAQPTAPRQGATGVYGGVDVTTAAKHLHVSRATLSRILNGKPVFRQICRYAFPLRLVLTLQSGTSYRPITICGGHLERNSQRSSHSIGRLKAKPVVELGRNPQYWPISFKGGSTWPLTTHWRRFETSQTRMIVDY